MRIEEKAIEIFKQGYVCDNCAGRQVGGLLSGTTNRERGKILRHYIAFLIDSGEKIDVDLSNFYGIKFRNIRIKPEKPRECKICKKFFLEKIEKVAKNIAKRSREFEFNTFLIGSIVSDDLLGEEQKLWEQIGIEFVESIKSEINRELGKKVERLTGKKFKQRNPDVTFIVNLNTGKIKAEIRSLYVLGGYKKLVRGLYQTKHFREKASIQEIIEKPLLKAAKAKKSSMHAMGREDYDARCLDFRPFVLELKVPTKRKMDLKKIEKEINKSRKIKVKRLRFTTKESVNKLKFAKVDKTYLAIADFEKNIERSKLKELKKLTGLVLQKTPLRVVRRRADKFRRRAAKKISWKMLGKKRLQLRIRAETGLYIKELITGDKGRTKPSVSELLNNSVKDVRLDVIKIHAEHLKL